MRGKLGSVKRIVATVLWVTLMFCLVFTTVSTVIQRVQGNSQPMVWGWGVAVVLTGSMEPEIPVGALVLINEKDDYMPNDVITYVDSAGRSVTHRLIAVSDNTAVAKGDANNAPDTPFNKSQIVGCVCAVIPGVGTVLRFIQNPIVVFCIAMVLLWVCFYPQIKARLNYINSNKEIDEKGGDEE